MIVDTGMRRGEEKSGIKEESSIVVKKKSWKLLMVEFLRQTTTDQPE